MFEDLVKASNEFKKANSVGIFSPKIESVDKATAMIAFAKVCLKKQKKFQVLCPKNLRTPIKNMFEKEGIQVETDVMSKDYIVSVDYSQSNIDKVVCKRDEETKKLNFVITPKDDIFNFDNVELISGGSSFDLLFSFGLNSLETLDENTRKLFESTRVVSITKKETDIGEFRCLINNQKSYSEVAYEFVKSFSDCVDESILNVLAQGVISKYKLLENGNNDGWDVISQFLKYGLDLNKSFRSLYYSKDLENLQLQKKVMENLRIDRENKMLWSKVNVALDVDSSNLDTKGRIVFNMSKDFDMAFVIYHLENGKIKVVFESNDTEKYPALELLRVFSGSGTNGRVVFTNKNIPSEEFERKLFQTINSTFGIQVSR